MEEEGVLGVFVGGWVERRDLGGFVGFFLLTMTTGQASSDTDIYCKFFESMEIWWAGILCAKVDLVICNKSTKSCNFFSFPWHKFVLRQDKDKHTPRVQWEVVPTYVLEYSTRVQSKYLCKVPKYLRYVMQHVYTRLYFTHVGILYTYILGLCNHTKHNQTRYEGTVTYTCRVIQSFVTVWLFL